MACTVARDHQLLDGPGEPVGAALAGQGRRLYQGPHTLLEEEGIRALLSARSGWISLSRSSRRLTACVSICRGRSDRIAGRARTPRPSARRGAPGRGKHHGASAAVSVRTFPVTFSRIALHRRGSRSQIVLEQPPKPAGRRWPCRRRPRRLHDQPPAHGASEEAPRRGATCPHPVPRPRRPPCRAQARPVEGVASLPSAGRRPTKRVRPPPPRPRGVRAAPAPTTPTPPPAPRAP